MRVWERGSGITQACGTGACATAVAAFLTEMCIRDRINHGKRILYFRTILKKGGSRHFNSLKQKTAYEISECDWSSDVCSSDLLYTRVIEHKHFEMFGQEVYDLSLIHI